MLVKKRFYQQTSFWRWALVLGLFALYLWLFRDDVVWVFWRSAEVLIWGHPDPLPEPYANPLSDLPLAMFNVTKFVLAFVVFLPLIILFTSQFILPVRTLNERLNVFTRLMLYAFNSHGPAIFIRDAHKIARTEELNLPYPGVVFVDLKSAVVLQKTSRLPYAYGPTSSLFDSLLNRSRPAVYQMPRLVRSEGPGIVFTSSYERIQGLADLRPQFRVNNGGGPEGVSAYTSDGIEVSSAIVITIFTLGQLPEVLEVVYIGEMKPDNLRVLTIEEKLLQTDESSKKWEKVKRIKSISTDGDMQDMDMDDKREIHGFLQDRLRIENLLADLEKLGLDEDALLSFVRRIGPKNSGTVQRFISNLYVNDQKNYRAFVNRLKPVDTETMHRFVVNKEFVYQLADALMQNPAEKAQVRAFINQLFTTYQNDVLDFYNQIDGAARDLLEKFRRRFYTNQQITDSYRPPRQIGSSPFFFDERRVFGALYANAGNPKDDSKIDDWTKLPPQVATEFYRTFIAKYSCNDLLGLEKPDKPPLVGTAKGLYGRAVRYQGVLAYRVIRRRDGQNPQEGDLLTEENYILDHPSLELRNPKILRDRGIKVIAATFSELRTSDPAIRQQRIENWKARWQSSIDETMTDFDFEIMRSRAQARAKAQSELIQNLSEIFSQPYTKEAMAVRIFQSLESAASDPETRRLLPQDTLAFIQNLRSWLLKDVPPGGQYFQWRNRPSSDNPPSSEGKTPQG